MNDGNRRKQAAKIRASRRRGVSLLEILVAIFILTVGLLGVAALIPVGHAEINKGEVAHRSAETGLRAYREMKLRGYLNPNNWLENGTPIVDRETGVMKSIYAGKTFVVDPLTSAKGGQGTGIPGARLVTVTGDTVTEQTRPNAMSSSVAERVFVSQDTLTIFKPKDATKPATQFENGGSGARRPSNPIYSWMAMLTPMRVLETDTVPEGFKFDTYMMSTVVFERNAPDGEGARKAITVGVKPLGGSEFEFSIPPASASDSKNQKNMLRPRRWVLLIDGKMRVYRWYRIGSVEGSSSENLTTRRVSLIGPDWDTQLGQPQGVMFAGVVGVVEKMVQLEGDTMWSPGAPNQGRK